MTKSCLFFASGWYCYFVQKGYLHFQLDFGLRVCLVPLRPILREAKKKGGAGGGGEENNFHNVR